MQTLTLWPCRQPSRWQLGGCSCAQGSWLCPPEVGMALHYLWVPLSFGTWKPCWRPLPLQGLKSRSPAGIAERQSPLNWSVSPLIPPFLPDIPDWFFFFFWGLKRCLFMFRPWQLRHDTSMLSLSVPPLSSSRLQHPGVKMNASHKKMWFEMYYGKKKYDGEKNLILFCFFFQFPQSYLKFWQWFHNKEVLAVMTTALERW